jgi:hypothetical protein
MGIGAEGVKKLVEAGIGAQEEHRRNAEQIALLYIEFGYKACERGESLEQAIINYRKIRR